MPVLSEPYAPVVMMSAPMYLVLAVAIAGLCTLLLRKRSRSTMSLSPVQTHAFLDEKRIVEVETHPPVEERAISKVPYQESATRMQRPPQPLPFTPPMPLIATQDLGFGSGANASYYSPLSESPVMNTFDTFDSFDTGAIDIPRRRSYTKTTAGGVEVTGEVVMGEGWRRHTKVFGGGVCIACEESDRRMTA